MMEKLGAPQTHLGLKAMIKVNKEQKSICFSFLVKSSFGDQVHFQIFWTKKNNAFSSKTVLKMWENKGDNLPRWFDEKKQNVWFDKVFQGDTVKCLNLELMSVA